MPKLTIVVVDDEQFLKDYRSFQSAKEVRDTLVEMNAGVTSDLSDGVDEARTVLGAKVAEQIMVIK